MNINEINTILCMISKLSTIEAINVMNETICSLQIPEDERKRLLDRLEEHKRFMFEIA